MKKLFLLVAVVAMLLPSCQKIEDAINALDNRVTELEGEKIPSIEQQIESINTSIADLEAVDIALKEQIGELEKSDEATAEEIANLQTKDAELELMIKTLQEYVNSLNQSTKDWISATFASLEQFNSLSIELADLKTLLENYKNSAATNLSNAISTLESSMKQWVNEQLSNYYTIAQIDAKITALEQQIQNGDNEELINEINSLKTSLQTMKSELTTAYQKAITDAINTNNGVISAKIAEEIATVNQRIINEINTINSRLDDIESRLDALEDKVDDLMNRKLEITFEETEDIAILAGGSCKVNYNITSSESEVHIATIAQNGWKASVTKSTEKTGYITVYAPNPLTSEPIIVLVSDANTTIMRSLTFVGGVISIETRTYALTNEATTLSIGVSTNLNYEINIPSSAVDWISLQNITSRAMMRNDIINLNIEENSSTYNREAVLSLVSNDEEVGEITISQQGIIIANNQLIYTSSDGATITPYQATGFNANIISNSCVNGRGIITFDNDITTIGEYAFYNCANLTSIRMPKSVNKIKDYAFYNSGLTNIEMPNNVTEIATRAFCLTDIVNLIIPDSVTTIGGYAFSGCTSLASVTIGNGVSSIEDEAFCRCTSLTSITIPDSVTSIGDYAFFECDSLTSVTIPDSVTSIGDQAFSYCDSLTSITIPDNVTSIGYGAFVFCDSLTSVTIGNNVTSIGDYAFFECDSLTSVTIGNGVTSIGYNAFLDCNSLKRVDISDLSAWCKISFGDSSANPLCNGAKLYLNGSELTNMTIPSDITEIKQYAFSDCTSLTSVTIGNSVTSIGYSAFYSCDSLTIVYCKPTTPPTGGSSMFDSSASGRTIYVPRNSVSAYKSASGWSDYKNYIVGYDF